MPQDGLPLPLIWNPGDRGWNRDQTSLSTANTFTNRIEGVSPVTKSDTPAVEAAQSTDTSANGRWCEFGPGNVRNLAAILLLPGSLFCLSFSEPIDVVSDPALISLDEFGKRKVWEGTQKIVEVTAVILNGTLGLPFFRYLLNEASCDRVLSH
ncbi:MAG TPA: hypothetical protein VFB12_29160 [Ktedonobacteraceae bacterium]|nr:hypothetical protein [Ktedonobacteraceae bacterium]